MDSVEPSRAKLFAVVGFLSAFGLAGCVPEKTPEERAEMAYREAMVMVRLCPDGTPVYRGPDGQHFASMAILQGGLQHIPEDVALVDFCPGASAAGQPAGKPEGDGAS